jgi:hypothetical protein
VALVGALVVFREQIGDVLNNIGDAFTSSGNSGFGGHGRVAACRGGGRHPAVTMSGRLCGGSWMMCVSGLP